MPSQNISWNTYFPKVTVLSFYRTISQLLHTHPATSSKHTASHLHEESQRTVLLHCTEMQHIYSHIIITAGLFFTKLGEYFPVILLKEMETEQVLHSLSHIAKSITMLQKSSWVSILCLKVMLPRTYFKNYYYFLKFREEKISYALSYSLYSLFPYKVGSFVCLFVFPRFQIH